jgi:hypothetical protein
VLPPAPVVRPARTFPWIRRSTASTSNQTDPSQHPETECWSQSIELAPDGAPPFPSNRMLPLPRSMILLFGQDHVESKTSERYPIRSERWHSRSRYSYPPCRSMSSARRELNPCGLCPPSAGDRAGGGQNGARQWREGRPERSNNQRSLRRCPVPDLQLLWELTPIGLRERVYLRRLRRLLVESRSLSSGSAFLMVRASRLTSRQDNSST